MLSTYKPHDHKGGISVADESVLISHTIECESIYERRSVKCPVNLHIALLKETPMTIKITEHQYVYDCLPVLELIVTVYGFRDGMYHTFYDQKNLAVVKNKDEVLLTLKINGTVDSHPQFKIFTAVIFTRLRLVNHPENTAMHVRFDVDMKNESLPCMQNNASHDAFLKLWSK